MNATAIQHPSGHWIVVSDDNDWLTSVASDDMGDFIAACRTARIDLTLRLLTGTTTRVRLTERGYRVQAWACALGLAALFILASIIQ